MRAQTGEAGMADNTDPDNLPQATVVPKRRTRISVVWLIPILAAVVAIGIAVQRILTEGPTITIVFKAAEGIEAGKTFVKYKDVNIGQVTAVQLSPDHSKVEVTAKIAKSAAGLMVEDTKFWVVEPRITLSGVSGLGTLLSGNYIGIEVGKSDKSQRTFIGLEAPLIITGGQPGRLFMLKADKLGSLGVGAPVYYRSLQAGQVIAYSLASDGKAIEVKIFVNAPYDRYVTSETRFWNASGIDVSVGAGGVDVRTESLVALIAGGLAFDTPPFAAPAEPAAANTVFTLYSDQPTAMKQPDPIARHFVLYFTETLRGLSVGAPVTILGLPGGEVTDVGLDIDPATQSLRGRVEIVAFPERLVARLHARQAAIGETLTRSTERRQAFFERMVEQRGMRAQLRSGNLLTGQLFVAFDFFADAPKAKIDWSQEPTELPAVPSTVTDLEAKLTSIVAKLDKLPYEAIGDELKKVLATADQVLKDADKAVNRIDTDVTPELKTISVELQKVLGTADQVLKDADNAVNHIDADVTPELKTTLEELRRATGTADRVLKDTDATLLGKNAPVQQELRDALQEIARAARSLRVLTDYLERHPESLLRGKTEETP
jgi:paraquat-inducible protein B